MSKQACYYIGGRTSGRARRGRTHGVCRLAHTFTEAATRARARSAQSEPRELGMACTRPQEHRMHAPDEAREAQHADDHDGVGTQVSHVVEEYPRAVARIPTPAGPWTWPPHPC